MNTLAEIIEKLSFSMQRHEAEVTARSEFGALSTVQIHYLDAVRHLGSPSISQIAECIGVSKPTATVAVDRLEKRGFVQKITSTEDRRLIHVHLTEAGLRISDLHDAIHKGYSAFFKEALSNAELKEVTRLLDKVVRHMGL